MFELFNDEDAITLLKHDHNKVKDLFDQFEKAENRREKKKIAAEAMKELKIHTIIEEEIFYPTVRRQPDVDMDIMCEADEEHHVAKLLIAELEQANTDEDHYDAKFKVLSEAVRHHIREEEGKMFPEARQSDLDFTALGQQLIARKQELKKNGIPASLEEKLMARTGARDDSPARAAKRNRAKAGSGRSSYSSSSRMPSGKKITRRRNG